MGRPRGFDEGQAIRAAAELFARHSYDGVSVDELVTHLGVHRNSLYKTFGSKRGLYLAALRWQLEHQLRPFLSTVDRSTGAADRVAALVGGPSGGAELDLLLLAAAEQAPADAQVAAEVQAGLTLLDQAFSTGTAGPGDTAGTGEHQAARLTATLLGLRLRARAGIPE